MRWWQSGSSCGSSNLVKGCIYYCIHNAELAGILVNIVHQVAALFIVAQQLYA